MKILTEVKCNNSPIKKFGNWSITFAENGRLTAVGKWSSCLIVLYDKKPYNGIGWATDFPEKLPKSVVDYLTNNYEKLLRIQNKKRGILPHIRG